MVEPVSGTAAAAIPVIAGAKPEPPQGLCLGYVNLYVSDRDRSLGFFTETLGLGLEFADKDFGYTSLEAGPLRMGLARIDSSDPQFAGWLGRQTGFGFSRRVLIERQ